jgi:LEA14-like dessication related protein
VRALLVLCVLTTACGWVERRKALKSCDFTIHDVALDDVRLRSATIRLDLLVYNPNDIDVVVERMDLCLYADDRCVARTHNPSGVTIPPYQKRPLTVLSDVSYVDSAAALVALVRHGPGNYQLRGTVHLTSALGEIPYDLAVP